MKKLQYDGPVVLVIMDGVGLAEKGPSNAVALARTDFLAELVKKYPHTSLEASGEAVGVLPGIMGNSEVGHNTIGTGQIIKQGIAKVEEAFLNGTIWNSAAWLGAISNTKRNHSVLHFAGIFSDGGVHSHIKHLEKMIEKAYAEGVKKIRIHAIFDGRDVSPQSEPKYITRFEQFAQKFEDADIKIASGGGRMIVVADRYEADWNMVRKGWDMMVHGRAEYEFSSPTEAITTFRNKNPELQDQYIPSFVITKNNEPIGKMNSGDSIIYFDFRADRAIEIAEAFCYENFPYFNRGKIDSSLGEHNYNPGDIYFAGLTEYNTDEGIPTNNFIASDRCKNTLSKFLSSKSISQFAIAETVKFGHITYYFNGNDHDKAKNEEFSEIASDQVLFDERPWMKAAEVTDAIINRISMPEPPRFVRVNYANGDMVGHTANIESTIAAVMAVDISLKRLAKKVDELGGCLVITADHGNAEELIDTNGNPQTSHTTNKVPFFIYDNTDNRNKYELLEGKDKGLANIAATVALFLGENEFPAEWQKPLINLK